MARVAVQKAQRELMKAMTQNVWPVTFSIGVITCHEPPQSVDELIKLADALAYTAKNSGKNTIEFGTSGAPKTSPVNL